MTDLKRYKRLYKLTGDTSWVAKYAAEKEKKSEDADSIALPTISQFVKNLVSANQIEFGGHHLQGLFGLMAAEALADFYDDSLDGDAPALIGVELKSKLSEGLSADLLSFSTDELKQIKENIRRRAYRSRDKQVFTKAKDLTDDQLSDLIQFALIRGYLHTYWLFVFENPILAIMLGSSDEDRQPPLTIKSMLSKAAAPDEEIDFSAFEELERELSRYEEEERAGRGEEDETLEPSPKPFVGRKAPHIRLSHIIEAMRILRLKKAQKVIERNGEGHSVVDLVTIDAQIKFLERVRESIKRYLKKDERNKFRTFLGQPLGGVDGEGDIFVYSPEHGYTLIQNFFRSILTSSNITIPFADIDGEGRIFGGGFKDRKYVGKLLPEPEEIITGFVSSRFESQFAYAEELRLSLVDDLKIAHQTAIVDAQHREKNYLDPNNSGKVFYALLLSGGVNEQTAQLAEKHMWYSVYDFLAEKLSEEEASFKLQKTDSDEFVNDFISFIKENYYYVGLLDAGWERSARFFLDAVIPEMGMITNFAALDNAVSTSLASTFSRNQRLKLSTVAKLQSEFSNPDDLRSFVRTAIDHEVKRLDLIYEHKAGDFRDPSKYRNSIMGDGKLPTEFMATIYAKFENTHIDQNTSQKEIRKKLYDIVMYYGRDMYADAFSPPSSVGLSFYAQYMKAGSDELSAPLVQELEKISPELRRKFNEWFQAAKSGEGSTRLPKELRESLESAMGSGALKLRRWIDNFNSRGYYRMAADELKQVLGSPYFKNRYEVWEEEYKAAIQKFDRTNFKNSKSEIVSGWYKMLSKIPVEDFGVRKWQIYLPQFKESKYSIERQYAELFARIEALRQWIVEHRLPQEQLEAGVDPDSFVKSKLVEVLQKEPPVEAVHALYVYIGEQLQMLCDAIPYRYLVSSKLLQFEEDGHIGCVSGLMSHKFKVTRERGFVGSPQVEILFGQQDSGRGVSVSPNESGEFQDIFEQRDESDEENQPSGMTGRRNDTPIMRLDDPNVREMMGYLENLSKGMKFDVVFTRDDPYEKRLDILRRRPAVALDSHTPGGWVQQMFYSLSPGMPIRLANHRTMVRHVANSGALSAGDKMRRSVASKLSKLWSDTSPDDPNHRPCFDNLQDMMEKVGAFADPRWAIAPFTEAFNKLEVAKRQNEYIADDPDTAYDHLQRVAFWVNDINCKSAVAEFKSKFDAVKDSVLDSISASMKKFGIQPDKAKLEEKLIYRFKRQEGVGLADNPTNNPFKKFTVKQMQKLLESTGLTDEVLEAYFGDVFAKQRRMELEGYSTWTQIVDPKDVEQRENELERNRLEMMNLQKYYVSDIQSSTRILSEVLTIVPDPLIPSAMELIDVVNSKIQELIRDPQTGSPDPKAMSKVFSNTQTWKVAVLEIIKSLDSKFNLVKEFFVARINQAEVEYNQYMISVSRFSEQLKQHKEWYDRNIDAIKQHEGEKSDSPLEPKDILEEDLADEEESAEELEESPDKEQTKSVEPLKDSVESDEDADVPAQNKNVQPTIPPQNAPSVRTRKRKKDAPRQEYKPFVPSDYEPDIWTEEHDKEIEELVNQVVNEPHDPNDPPPAGAGSMDDDTKTASVSNRYRFGKNGSEGATSHSIDTAISEDDDNYYLI